MKRLRPYQLDAFAYTLNVNHPALYMRMRLGKTLVAVRRLRLYKPRDGQQRFLIVAPSSALGAWEDELADEGEASVACIDGTRKQRLDKLNEGWVWNLINKEGFLAVPEIGAAERCAKCGGKRKVERDEERVPCGKCRGNGWTKTEHQATVQWDAVVVDESVFIKSPRSLVTKFFLACFHDVPHRWILTGLPNPEGPLDYVAQMLFLDGEFLGHQNYWSFRQGLFMPHYSGYGWIPKKNVEERIDHAVGQRCFVLRRRDVGLDREKIRQRRVLKLPSKLRRAYDTAERDFILEYDDEEKASTIWRMVQYTWLRKMCGGFVDDELVWRGKVNEVVDLVTGELANEQVVVWFNFNDELLATFAALDKRKVSVGHLYGAHQRAWRDEVRRAFQRGDTRVLLMQQKIGETGMNLSAASTAIYYSEPLGLHAKQQTEDRILDVDTEGPLLFIHLVVENSVDVDVAKANETKRARSDQSLTRALARYMSERGEGK